AFSQFSSDLDPETQARLARGHLLTELLKQPQYSPMSVWQQVVSIVAGTSGAFDGIAVEKIKTAQEALLTAIEQKQKDLVKQLDSGEKPTEDQAQRIIAIAEEVAKPYRVRPPEKSAPAPEQAKASDGKEADD